MKLSGKILSDALNYSIKNKDVLRILQPIDISQNFTIKQINTKIVTAQDNSAILQIEFDYIPLNADTSSPKIIVTIEWSLNSGFTIRNIGN